MGEPGSALSARRPWNGHRVVLGVTGGIAAYKSVQLARDLTRLGATVDVVLTRSAKEFVAPLTFEGVTGRPSYDELFSTDGAAMHIRLGQEADVVCVAPATADFMARAAQGRADDLLTTTLLATDAPVVVCPAMNDRMFAHPQTQANVEHLRGLGYEVAGPAVGPLAAGEGEGPGRMLEPAQIVECVGRALARSSEWTERHVLITAGPTREAVDPVRFIGNRSSGKMGYALARAAWRRGSTVTVVSGPTTLAAPFGVEVVSVESATEMNDAVRRRIGDADVVVFAAAVADYRPEAASDSKLKKSDGGPPTIRTAVNPDIAAGTRDERKPGAFAIGFALETDDLESNARAKLGPKGLDLIVANSAAESGSGFEVDTNRVTLIEADKEAVPLPLQSKDEVAEEILDRVPQPGQ